MEQGKREDCLNSLLLRMVISGIAAGFVAGVIISLNVDTVIDTINRLSRHYGVSPHQGLEGETPLIRGLLMLSPLLQPVNQAVSVVILGLISWWLSSLSGDRCNTTRLLSLLLYTTITMASTLYLASSSKSPVVFYLLGAFSIIVFVGVLLFLEWRNLPGSEPGRV